MKLILTAVVLAQVSTALIFAQTPQRVGEWSVYSPAATHKDGVTLIQTASEEKYANNDGELVTAKMDAVCVNGKLAGVAVDTNSVVPKDNLNIGGPVDTTPVVYKVGNQPQQSESWAVLDHGRTLSPYAKVLQGRRTREWEYRVASSGEIVLHVGMTSSGDPVKVTFKTAGFTQALSMAQCTY